MTTRSNGPSAGWAWLANGLRAGFRHPRPLLGGAALLMVVCMLPTLVTLPMQLHAMATRTPQSPAAFGWTMAFSMLFGLLIMPIYAGYLQVMDAAERGLPARALDIFNPYRQGDALRLIGFGLANMLLYIIAFGVVIAAMGGGIVGWYMQVMAAQATHQPPPALPPGFGTAVALCAVLGLFMMGYYAISLGQVALRRRGVFGAIGDGVTGALKNVLPLVVLALSFLLAWVVVIIGFVIVALVLALLGKLLGMWLAFVLMIPLYVALLLTVFTVMFGTMYHLWRDVCGGDAATDMAAATAV